MVCLVSLTYPAKELVRLILLDACPYCYILLVHMRVRLLHIYICVLISRKSSHTAGYVSAFYCHIRAYGCYICVRISRRSSYAKTGALHTHKSCGNQSRQQELKHGIALTKPLLLHAPNHCYLHRYLKWQSCGRETVTQ